MQLNLTEIYNAASRTVTNTLPSVPSAAVAGKLAGGAFVALGAAL